MPNPQVIIILGKSPSSFLRTHNCLLHSANPPPLPLSEKKYQGLTSRDAESPKYPRTARDTPSWEMAKPAIKSPYVPSARHNANFSPHGSQLSQLRGVMQEDSAVGNSKIFILHVLKSDYVSLGRRVVPIALHEFSLTLIQWLFILA